MSRLNEPTQSEEKDSINRQKSKRDTLTPTVRTPTRIPSYSALTYTEDLGQTPTGNLYAPISASIYESWSVDSVGRVLVVYLTILAPLIHLPPSFVGVPELCLICGCGIVSLFSSVSG